MRTGVFLGLIVLLLAGCGDSDSSGAARTSAEVCDEVCGWPDQCFVELGVPLADATCVSDCMQSVEVVGLACLQAIAGTVSCLGTCDFNALTDADIQRCQGVAQSVVDTCE